MACSLLPNSDQGYATPAAMVISLALALVGSALVARSVQLLRLSKLDLERLQIEYSLSGAQLEAATQVVRSVRPGPFYWTDGAETGWVELRAEPEADKLSLAAAATLSDGTFAAFEVKDPTGLKRALSEASEVGDYVEVADLDAAPLWRACADRVISSFGRQDHLTYTEAQRPQPDPKNASWRIGEVWRLRVTTAAGWRDDRIVRFTGDARHPAAVVVRRLSRGDGGGGLCDATIIAAAAA
ncbi:hypothetical protein [Phenylobacterium sp.]|uniref:hypothetical protein n=1 Tax=Phenylobacterium sp. TaxID=1871053 RepID=UPI00286DD7D0|nr:hypothetical protein [Phenylobacterium sp.]